MSERFENWKYPKIEEDKPTKYNWIVQHKNNVKLGYKTDIGAPYSCKKIDPLFEIGRFYLHKNFDATSRRISPKVKSRPPTLTLPLEGGGRGGGGFS